MKTQRISNVRVCVRESVWGGHIKCVCVCVMCEREVLTLLGDPNTQTKYIPIYTHLHTLTRTFTHVHTHTSPIPHLSHFQVQKIALLRLFLVFLDAPHQPSPHTTKYVNHILIREVLATILSTFYVPIFLHESGLSSFSLRIVWLWTNLCTKNAHIKCWWNWLLDFDTLMIMKQYCKKVLSQLDIFIWDNKIKKPIGLTCLDLQLKKK